MSIHTQPEGSRGSLKWIQRAVEEQWPSLVDPVLARLGHDRTIEWRSPLRSEQFAEYRDEFWIALA